MSYTTINKSGLHFNTKLYAGSNSTQAVTGVGFQPDWVWIKNRSSTPDHKLHDAVRGSNKNISSNTSAAEQTYTYFNSFDSDGFTLDGNVSDYNQNGSNFVSWNWKGNGAGSSNSSGSITSTVSVNTTAGFSIVKYTGTGSAETVGHGLGVAPKMIIVKNLGTSDNWGVWHTTLGEDEYLGLNQQNGQATNSAIWNSTYPTSTVFSIGNNARTGGSYNYIAYCFAEKIGFSKFGSYTGNGNADGPFIYTGFKPAFVLMKRYGSTGNWVIQDNRRSQADPGNPANRDLNPSNSEAEEANNGIDIVSNGFKQRNTDGDSNAGGSGNTYIYMAFGQTLVGSNNVPASAR